MSDEYYYEFKNVDGTVEQRFVKYLENGNQVKLKKGVVVFAPWSNAENNECFDKAVKEVPNFKSNDKIVQAKLMSAMGEWQLSYSLSHGAGFLTKLNVDDVRRDLNNINVLDIFELEKLKRAFDEYVLWMKGDVKKKVETQSTQK